MSEAVNETAPAAPDYSDLPLRWQEPLELRDKGMEYAAIADHLGVAVGTVKSRIHRARAAIAKKSEAAGGAT